MRGEFDPNSSLDFEFDDAGTDSPEEIANLIGGQLVDFGDKGRTHTGLTDLMDEETEGAEALPDIPPAGGLRVLSGAAVQAGETPLGRRQQAPEPVELVLDSGKSSPQVSPYLAHASIHPLDLMRRRMAAGLLDSLMLLLGLGVFTAIFLAVRPKSAIISLQAINLVAMGLVVAFLIAFYFGTSVAFTSSTPGLMWMGLEIRTFDGEAPNARASCWRAFGYLVSASALFLGFAWAMLDSDGLTWHDLMSGTFVTERGRPK